MGQITIRMSDEDENEVKRIVNGLSMDLNTVTGEFYQRIIRERRIPLDFDLNSALPKETREALNESMKMENDDDVMGYDSGASFIQSLHQYK